MDHSEATQRIKSLEVNARLRKMLTGGVLLLGVGMWLYAFYNILTQGW